MIVEERRNYKRVQENTPCVVYLSNGIEVRGTLLNVSETGFKAKLDESVSPFQKATVCFCSDEPVIANAYIKWANPTEGGGCFAGFEVFVRSYDYIKYVEKKKVDLFLDSLRGRKERCLL